MLLKKKRSVCLLPKYHFSNFHNSDNLSFLVAIEAGWEQICSVTSGPHRVGESSLVGANNLSHAFSRGLKLQQLVTK